jgi:hypothetical protein
MNTWPTENDPTNPSATPVYDGIGWADYWSAADWITWHRAMKLVWGVNTANRNFVNAWDQDSFFNSAPLSARSFDSSFREYAKANGFLDALYGGGVGVLAKPLGVVSDAADAVSDLGAGVKNAGAAVGAILPFAVVGVLAYLVWVKLGRPKIPKPS